MIIESKGIKIAKYFIPPFELMEGELLGINLHGGVHYHSLKMDLVAIFTGRISNKNVKIHKPISFVEYFQQSRIQQFFHPMTVGNYLKNHADLRSHFATKIYEINWIDEKTKLNTFAGTPRKLLSLYTTLSKTNDIVFDLDGQDPIGANETFQIAKEAIQKKGSAILIDWVDDMRTNCTKFITIE